MKEEIEKLLKNRSLVIFAGIVVAAILVNFIA